jgi:hypothetical protein
VFAGFRSLTCVVACLAALLMGSGLAAAQMPDMADVGHPASRRRPARRVGLGARHPRRSVNPIVGNVVEMRIGDKVTSVNTDDREGPVRQHRARQPRDVLDSGRRQAARLAAPSTCSRKVVCACCSWPRTQAPRRHRPRRSAPLTGPVTIAGESRIVIEPGDGTLAVYYILDIVNASSSPVNPEKPFVFTMPADATNTTVIQGSSPLASNKGREVTVVGPFPPGTTAIQVAAEFPVTSGSVSSAGLSRRTCRSRLCSRRRKGLCR